jgi:hypothetical protein
VRKIAVLLSLLVAACAGWGFGGPNERIVAQFTIRAGGSVTPRTITVPAHIPVILTLVSHDRRAHRVLLRAPGAKPLAVPAHGQIDRRFNRLAAGTYALDVDGARRATLDIGGAPGP